MKPNIREFTKRMISLKVKEILRRGKGPVVILTEGILREGPVSMRMSEGIYRS